MSSAPAIEAANGIAPTPPAITLRDLAARLTPNPARTIDGTLQILLDGIDKIDNEALARALGHVGARESGLDAQPLTDEEWSAAPFEAKLRLMHSSKLLKLALREMAK